MTRVDKTPFAIAAVAVALIAGAFVFPDWFSLMIVAIIAKGLVALGVVALMRSGLVSFGQGLFYCIGGYAVGLSGQWFGITDIFLLLLIAALAGLLVGGVLGLLMSRYREIFFAMFSLALGMILYSVLSRSTELGSTDGFNVLAPTLFGKTLAVEQAKFLIYVSACVLAAVVAILVHRYFRSPMGYAGLAVNDNEIRVEYLGLAPRHVFYSNYVLAGVAASLGGAITALNYGHVGPDMSYWAMSGEFVFIALMGGTSHVAGAFIGSAVFEVVRTYALEIAPYAWRLILGSVLILLIVFLPKGLWSLTGRWSRTRGAE